MINGNNSNLLLELAQAIDDAIAARNRIRSNAPDEIREFYNGRISHLEAIFDRIVERVFECETEESRQKVDPIFYNARFFEDAYSKKRDFAERRIVFSKRLGKWFDID